MLTEGISAMSESSKGDASKEDILRRSKDVKEDTSKEDILRQIFGNIGELIEGMYVLPSTNPLLLHNILSPDSFLLSLHRFYMCSRKHSVTPWPHVHHQQVHLLLFELVRPGEKNPYPVLPHQIYFKEAHSQGHSERHRHLYG